MENKIRQIKFEENIVDKEKYPKLVSTINLPEINLSFSRKFANGNNFLDLRDYDYGPGFKMSSMGKLAYLVNSSIENQEKYDSAKNIKVQFYSVWFSTNTGILYSQEGIFVQDNPNIVDGKISMVKEDLENKLCSKEEKGVIFSEDKEIRFTPYGFKTRRQDSYQLSKNRGIIALVGGEENAEILSEISEYNGPKSFWTAKNFNLISSNTSQKIFATGIGTGRYDMGFNIGALDNEHQVGISFGVKSLSEN